MTKDDAAVILCRQKVKVGVSADGFSLAGGDGSLGRLRSF